jgi:hypothetical protein
MKKTMICIIGACVAAAAFVIGCSSGADSPNMSGSPGSRGGSMARFTVVGDWLYTVDDSKLNVVSIADPAHPVDAGELWIGSDIETIFAMDDLLFIGSQSAMHIYDIEKPEFPEFVSTSSHFKSCDPVVAAGTLAFVTLNSSLGSWCGQRGDRLIAYDISDVYAPVVIDEVQLSSPRGLAVDIGQKMLFVCDNGIRAFDISDPENIEILYSSVPVPEVGRIDAYDCIVLENDSRLLVIGADGLYQLAYDREGFTFISKIDIRSRQ